MAYLCTLVLGLVAAAAGAQPRIDFSYAGYGGGGVPAPTVPVATSVRPTGGDDTELLQQAIDHVSALPVRESGFRGAVRLRPGRYRVAANPAVMPFPPEVRTDGTGEVHNARTYYPDSLTVKAGQRVEVGAGGRLWGPGCPTPGSRTSVSSRGR